MLPKHSQVPLRILFHLGASALLVTATTGCKQADPPVAPTTPATEPTATATPTATAAASSSADTQPTASAAPPPTTTTTTAPKKKRSGTRKVGATCNTDEECSEPLDCVLSASASRRTGTCQWPMPEGRPLMVDGTHRIAEAALGSSWTTDAAPRPVFLADGETRAKYIRYFRGAAFDEHASIASFARTICELMALGAPSQLVRKTQAALADEIDHAELCFAWLAALDEKPIEPGSFPEAIAPLRSAPSDLLRDILTSGCISETLAACRAAEQALEAPDPELRSFFERIVEDEARHAALAFETAQWLLLRYSAGGELHRIVRDVIASFDQTATDAERALLTPLFEVFATTTMTTMMTMTSSTSPALHTRT